MTTQASPLPPLTLREIRDAVAEGIRRAQMPELLTIADVTRWYGLSTRQQEYRRAQGILPYVQHGRSIRYRRADLDAFAEAGLVPATRPPATDAA